MAYRLKGRYGYPQDDPFRVTFHPNRLDEPFHWKRSSRVFTVSMGDLFHKDVKFDWQLQTWLAIERNPRHIFMILTKRPERMKHFFDFLFRDPVEKTGLRQPFNLWLGVSISTNKDLWMVETLLQIPAAKRFVSVEPMLGRIDFRAVDLPDNHIVHPDHTGLFGISWVICGGESGPKARPMHPDWARLLRDQCQAAAVPFFFKHWGEWSSNKPDPFYKKSKRRYSHETFAWARDGKIYNPINPPINHFPSIVMHKVGKKKAGRLLDGKEWNEIPV
jgi:protein gp37